MRKGKGVDGDGDGDMLSCYAKSNGIVDFGRYLWFPFLLFLLSGKERKGLVTVFVYKIKYMSALRVGSFGSFG